jgi:hypothetical protein
MEKCPKCGAERKPEDTQCYCGLIYGKYQANLIKKQYQANLTKKKNDANSIKKKNDAKATKIDQIAQVGYKEAKSIFWKLAITVCIVLLLAAILGKIPLFSVIFGSDDEVMYIANYDKCRCNTKITASPECERSCVMFKIEVGNTGKNDVQLLDIKFKNVPFPIDQVYFSAQNLSIAHQRISDPKVEIVCADNTSVECKKIVPLPSFPHRCEFFTLEYSLPRSHRIEFDPCYKIDSVIPEELLLKIRDFSSGTLLSFGFLSYDTEENVLDWKDLGQINIEVKGEAKIVVGDPQSTTLARFLYGIVDLF